jgi:hypothetical protein
MSAFDTFALDFCRVCVGITKLDLVQNLAARFAGLEVVVALHGLLQGEAAVNLRG